ncbi:MAG: tandem-95 repeat protein [Thermoplasmatota archaeon]
MKFKGLLFIILMTAMISLPHGIEGSDGTRSITPKDDPVLPPIGFYRGILPTNATGEDLSEAYANVSKHTHFVPVWGRPSPFYEFADDIEGGWGDLFVEELIRGNGMFPLVHMNFYGQGYSLVSPGNITDPTLNHTTWRNVYKQSAIDIVTAARPAYFSVGNEVNRWLIHHGMNGTDDGFENFISLYNEIYDEVKTLSPDTKVFCTFARENVEGHDEADLSFLGKFDPDRLDLLVFTSYPYSNVGINEPLDIRDDYYSSAYAHIENMPFGFSELGWSSREAFGGEEGQADFLNDAYNRLTRDQGLDLELFGWAWLTDLSTETAVGLRNMDGTEKASYSEWLMNEKPVFDPYNRTINLTEDFGIYGYDLNRTFSDPDSWDWLTFSVWNGTDYANNTEITPASIIYADVEGHYLKLYSLDNRSGIAELTILAEDTGGESVWTRMRINVNETNDPPALIRNPAADPFLEDRSEYIDLSYYIVDSDDDLLDLDISVIRSPHIEVTLNIPIMVLYSKEADWSGTSYVLMNISDSHGAYTHLNLSVTILPENDAPMILAPERYEMQEDESKVVDLGKWEFDKDSVHLTWSLYEDGVYIHAEVNRSNLTLRPLKDWSGSDSISLNLSDGELSVTKALTIEVSPVNDPPAIDIPDMISFREDTITYVNLSEFNAHDPDGDFIVWEVLNFTEQFKAVSFPLNGTMRISPVLDANGEGTISVNMKDNKGGETPVVFDVWVIPVNDPPHMKIPENWTYSVDVGGSITIDFTEEEYDLFDIESPHSDLIIRTTFESCTVDGLTITITIPADTVAEEITVPFTIRDPYGGESDTYFIVLDIIHPPVDTRTPVNVTSMNVSTPDGYVIITAEGDPGQTIYVVFSDGTCVKMNEVPAGSGKYIIEYGSDDWTDGQELTFHLSSTFQGPNDTPYSETGFTFVRSEEEPDDYTIYYIIAGALALIILILIVFTAYRKSNAPAEDFDYGSLMEE